MIPDDNENTDIRGPRVSGLAGSQALPPGNMANEESNGGFPYLPSGAAEGKGYLHFPISFGIN